MTVAEAKEACPAQHIRLAPSFLHLALIFFLFTPVFQQSRAVVSLPSEGDWDHFQQHWFKGRLIDLVFHTLLPMFDSKSCQPYLQNLSPNLSVSVHLHCHHAIQPPYAQSSVCLWKEFLTPCNFFTT